MLGAAAMCGLPLFNGFVSEFITYVGLISGLHSGSTALSVSLVISFAIIGFVGAAAIISFTKLFSIVFLGTPRTELHENIEEVPLAMRIPQLFQISLIILTGIFPQFVFRGIIQNSASFFGSEVADIARLYELLSKLSECMIIFIAIILSLFLLRRIITKNRKVASEPTWGCAYSNPNARMQYTGHGYSSPFSALIINLRGISKHKKTAKHYFPEESEMRIEYYDAIEQYLFMPLIKKLHKFLAVFGGIQTGKTHLYILYGLIFLIGVLLWTVIGAMK